MSNFLFDELPVQSAPQSPAHCKDCGHIEKWELGNGKSVFFYCGITKSSRTGNGLKKVQCKTPACGLFEEKVK